MECVDRQDILTVGIYDMATPLSFQKLSASRETIMSPRLKHRFSPKIDCYPPHFYCQTYTEDRVGKCIEVGHLVCYNNFSEPLIPLLVSPFPYFIASKCDCTLYVASIF